MFGRDIIGIVETDLWQLWWIQDGVTGLRQVLMEEWDPLFVAGVREAQDEYDIYVLHIGRMLCEGATHGDIQAYLSLVRTESIGLPSARTDDQRAATAIRRWWTQQLPPPMPQDTPLTAENLALAMRASLPELAPDFQRLVDEWEDEEPGITLVADVLVPHVVDAARADDEARLRVLSTFMERMATSPDRRIQDALMAGVLEVVGDDRPALDRARESMGPRTLALSIEVETFWGREPP